VKILLVVYDNGSYIHWFPQGLAYIAAVLLKNGHQVEIYNQDMHHYPEKHLVEKLNRGTYDVVGVSVIGGYYQYQKLLKISAAINEAKNRPFFIIGGHGPSPEPAYFLGKTKADAVVIGEGELTIIELLNALANNISLADVKGIAFRMADKVQINERRDLIKDIDTIPFPAYHLFPLDYYRLFRMPSASNSDFVMTVLSGRGCTFQCNFCYRMDKGFRARRNDCIVEEISLLKRDFGITYITFGDELLMSSIERTMSLCEAFLKAELNIRWDCNGRLNYAKPEVLKLMKKAGCTFINYGIESMDDLVLKNMKKGLTTELIVRGIEATLKYGISPGFNIIFGNIGETKEALNKGVEFLLKYDDGGQMRTIRPVTPYPGSPLYYHAIKKGLLKDCEDFYENKHTNSDLLAVNFTSMSDDEFHTVLLDANTRLLKNYFQKKMRATVEQAKNLYIKKDRGFRGFRSV
jgi:anaerobic magnesium-protoporphyrin IX monomethyl ester cyclase